MMTKKTMEDVYTALADGIDSTGRDKESLFLSKVALLLAERLNNPELVLKLIANAQKNMEGMRA